MLDRTNRAVQGALHGPQVFQAQENRERAVQAYTAALNVDPFCYEAFQVCIQAYPHIATSSPTAVL